jgi:UTP--glucose-1-phosphate uridylyltransferase
MKTEALYLVIPAAGLGTRMRAVDPSLPKEMIPVGKRPAIHYSVIEGIAAGIQEIIIIINRDKEVIRSYFENSKFRNRFCSATENDCAGEYNRCSISFLYQKDPLGESDAISLAEGIVGNNAMAVIYPDNIYLPSPGALRTLSSVFRSHGKDICALMKVTDDNIEGISDSGRVDLEVINKNFFRITKVLPKREGIFIPRFRGELRTCGISMLAPGYFDLLRRARFTAGSGEFTDQSVRELAIKAERLFGYLLPGDVFDIGNPRGYRLCLEYVKKYGTSSLHGNCA